MGLESIQHSKQGEIRSCGSTQSCVHRTKKSRYQGRIELCALLLCVLVGSSACRQTEESREGRSFKDFFRKESEVRPSGPNPYQKVTGDDAEDDRGQWDRLFEKSGYLFGTEPAEIVKESLHFLPKGKVLDIAMGEGRNAVFMAKKGFIVDGVDYSQVAIQKAKRLAKIGQVQINTINADLNHYVIKPEAYEVILNIQYLQKSLVAQIKRGLKKRGVVVYENYTVDHLSNPEGKSVPREWVLEKGELRALFSDFEILVYRETNNGKEAVASLIARKP